MEEKNESVAEWREFVHKAWKNGETVFAVSKEDGEKQPVIPYTEGNRLVWTHHNFVVHIFDTDLGI